MTTARPQQRYDHRLRELVQRTGDATIATDLGVPSSTARGWLRTAPAVVVSLDLADLPERELRHEVLKLRRRVQKLAALLRLVLALLRVSGFTLFNERLPDGQAKMQILRAIDQVRACISRSVRSCGSSVSRRVGPCLAPATPQLRARRSAVLSPHIAASTDHSRDQDHRRHGDLARLPARPHGHARRPGPATRPGLGVRVDLVPPRQEIRLASAAAPRASREAEDRPADHAPRRDVAHRHQCRPPARRKPRLSARRHRQLLTPDLGMAGRRYVRPGQQRGRAPRRLSTGDILRHPGRAGRWRSLKHQWLFLHHLDSVATVRRLVGFYVHEHNAVLPHSAFCGQTPDEMYFGTGDAVPADLATRASPPAPHPGIRRMGHGDVCLLTEGGDAMRLGRKVPSFDQVDNAISITHQRRGFPRLPRSSS